MDFTSVPSIGTSIPDFVKPNKEKDKEWHRTTGTALIKNFVLQKGGLSGDTNNVELYRKLYLYYYGRQENISYKFMTEIMPGINLPAKWVAGEKCAELIEWMKGKMCEIYSDDRNVNARATSNETSKKKQDLFDKVRVVMEMKEFADKIEEISGLSMSPMPKFQPKSEEEIDKFSRFNYKEGAEVSATVIARSLMHENHYMEFLDRLCFDVITTGLASCRVNVVDGHIKWENIHPMEAITSFSKNNDYQRGNPYAGRRRWLTIPEVAQEYHLTADELQRVHEIANNGSIMDELNDFDYYGGNTVWWRFMDSVPHIAVYDLEWIDFDLDIWEQYKDSLGTNNVVSTEKTRLSEGEIKKGNKLLMKPVGVPRVVTIIGNSITLNWGKRLNIVRDSRQLAETELSFQIFTPNMMFGDSRSFASRLAAHQDKIDLYEYKIELAIQNDKGRKLEYDVAQKPKGKKMSQVKLEYATDGVVETDSSSQFDITGQLITNKRATQVVDLGLDLNSVNGYLLLIDKEKREMEEIVSIPRVLQGAQTQVIGKAVQQNTAAFASIGTLSFWTKFRVYFNNILQYSLNTAKIVYTREGSYEGAFVCGDGMVRYLTITKDFAFEDFTVYIDSLDSITPTEKAEMLMLAQAALQNQQIDFIDFIKIKPMSTYTEIVDYLEYAVDKKQKAMAAQQQAQMQQEQQLEQQKGDNMVQANTVNQVGSIKGKQIESETQIQKQNLQNKGKVVGHLLDQEARNNEQASAEQPL